MACEVNIENLSISQEGDNCIMTLKEIEEAVTELYHFRDHFFDAHNIVEESMNKSKQVAAELQKTVALIKKHKNYCEKENRGRFYYLWGRALNITPEFNPEALEMLKKSVKLDYKLTEAWNELGECLWRKGDMEDARNCFEGALRRGTNKVSLRSLSMVLRQLGNTKDEKRKNVLDSVTKAKEAVNLDIDDGISWLILGNAYLTAFFTLGQDPKLLKQSMAAYRQAGREWVVNSPSAGRCVGKARHYKNFNNFPKQTANKLNYMLSNETARNQPDLHYNRSIALKYEEEYQEALKGFVQSQLLDYSWEAPKSKEKDLLQYLQKVKSLIVNKGQLKPKRLQTFTNSLSNPLKDLGPYGGGKYVASGGRSIILDNVMLSSLIPGINAEKVVLGKVICQVSSEDPIPFTFCIVDKCLECHSVTVYNLAQGQGVIIGDSVAIPEPFVQLVDVNHNETVVKYSNIRVDSPMVLVVNGKKFGLDKHAPSEIGFTKSQ